MSFGADMQPKYLEKASILLHMIYKLLASLPFFEKPPPK